MVEFDVQELASGKTTERPIRLGGTTLDDVDDWFRSRPLPGVDGAELTAIPLPADSASGVKADSAENRFCQLWFVDDDLPATWTPPSPTWVASSATPAWANWSSSPPSGPPSPAPTPTPISSGGSPMGRGRT